MVRGAGQSNYYYPSIKHHRPSTGRDLEQGPVDCNRRGTREELEETIQEQRRTIGAAQTRIGDLETNLKDLQHRMRSTGDQLKNEQQAGLATQSHVCHHEACDKIRADLEQNAEGIKTSLQTHADNATGLKEQVRKANVHGVSWKNELQKDRDNHNTAVNAWEILQGELVAAANTLSRTKRHSPINIY